jgi:hypothetical protein
MHFVRTKRLQAVTKMIRQAMSRKATIFTDDDYERVLEAISCDDYV